MSQRTKKKRRFTLQVIACLGIVIGLVGCASYAPPKKDAPVPTSHSLAWVKTIDKVGVGSNDIIKRILAGDEQINLRRPVAIALRDDIMIIADRGELVEHARTHAILSDDKKEFIKTLPHDVNYMVNNNVAIASSRSGTVAVEDYNRGVFFRLNLKTGRMNVIRGAGDIIDDEVSDIYIARDHSFYVTDIEGRRALHFAPDGKLLKIYKHPPNIFRPIAITVDEERKEVLVADETYSHIVAFDMEKAEPIYGMGDRGNGPGKFRIITDMIAIPDGFLVSDRIELRVQVLDRAGNYIADFGRADLMFPTALAMDKFGRVYVADKSDSTIKVYKAGKLIETIGRNGYGPMEFRYISDMKIHRDQLYVVDNLNGRIQVFDILPEGSKVAAVH